MLVPKLRFKEFTGENNVYIIEDVFTNKTKSFNPSKEKEKYKCIELEHIIQNSGLLNGFTYSDNQLSTKNFFISNSVLFGKLRPYLKKYYFPNFDGVCSSEIWVLNSLNNKTLLNNYLYYYIQTNYFMTLANHSTGSKMPRADWGYIKYNAINLPSIKEQEKIAKLFTLLDKLIELQQRKIEALKLYNKGTINLLITNLSDYKIAKLSELGHSYSGLTGKSKEDFDNGESKYIPYMSVFKNSVSEQTFLNVKININEKQNKVLNKDLFFTVSSETKEEVGMCSTINEEYPSLYLNSFCFGFRINNLNIINNNYLCCLLLSSEYRKIISNLGQGFTRVNLSKINLLKIEIKYPQINMQELIASFVTENTKNINLNNDKLNKMIIIKKGLLQQMFV